MDTLSLPLDGRDLVAFSPTPAGPNGLLWLHRRFALDQRGHFSVTWAGRDRWYQDNEVFSYEAGTIRGLHYQGAMWAQSKLIRVLVGRIFDVCVHLETQTTSVFEMTPLAPMLYVPKGFAHGYMTLEPDTIVAYKISDVWSPENEAGLRWNDPALAIQWPRLEPILNDRDASWPLLAPPA